jgi:SAM-dependent methyltransferase
MTDTPSEHWSDYWSRGCLTSLPQDFAINYDGEVAAFWHAAIRALPPGGRMIDLCTGNGAIALLAAAFGQANDRPIEITAVDAAQVSPEAIVERFPEQARLLEDIRFISPCRIEELELEAQFDLATSQYGIEYCDWEPAAARVAQLLKPGGRLLMVCHSAGSDIMAYMEREQREFQQLEALGFFSAIRGYLDRKTGHAGLVAALRAVQSELQKEFSRSGSPLYRSVLEMLKGALAMPEARLDNSRAHLEAYYLQTRHGFDRLADMLRVNQALKDDPGWTRVFEAAGLIAEESGQIRYRGQHHAGDFHAFRKPQAAEK